MNDIDSHNETKKKKLNEIYGSVYLTGVEKCQSDIKHIENDIDGINADIHILYENQQRIANAIDNMKKELDTK